MMNVKIGDKVQATGMGALFVGLVGGVGTGVVVHVQNPELIISDPRVQEEVDAGIIEPSYLNDGILYVDDKNNEICWLAPNDFEVIL